VAFWREFVEQVESIPGVERASVTAQLPLETGTYEYYLLEGESHDPERIQRGAWRNFISPGYFEAMGLPLLAGRTLNDSDGADISIPTWRPDQPTQHWGVVINRALAERAWPDENPLGKRLYNIETPKRWSAVVVGVVEGIRQQGPERRSEPAIYWLYEANPFAGSSLVVRSGIEPLALVAEVRERLAQLDTEIPLSSIRTMEMVMDSSMRSRYFVTLLTGLFTAIAVILAMAGTYGIMSYYVAQRTHEIGVRVALGASRWRLLVMVFRQAFVMLAFGIGVGLMLIVNASFIARRWVYGISPLDPLYICVGIAFIVTVATVATTRPALKATRVDPVVALRTE
jgi:predicted permease